jgi:hypothetical protein
MSKVFYAWQSDRPGNVNRSFIEKALDAAIAELNTRPEIESAPRPELDKDTQGIPGSPPIPETILAKIKACDVFIADVTFIGRSDVEDGEESKYLPNPNVLYELGYAFTHLGPDRIIMVMNIEYGTPESLPFDLRHRRITTYTARINDQDRSAERKRLTSVFQDAIAAAIGQRREREPLLNEQSANQLREQFQVSVLTNQFHEMTPDAGICGLIIIPRQTKRKIDLGSTAQRFAADLVPMEGGGNRPAFRGRSIITALGNPPSTVTELSDDGTIRAVSETIMGTRKQDQFFPDILADDVAGFVPSVEFERVIISATHRYLSLLTQLGFAGFYVGICLWRVNRFIMAINPRMERRDWGRPFPGDHIQSDLLAVPSAIDLSLHLPIASVLKPALDYIWREFAYPRSLNFDDSDHWKPSR